MAECTGAQLHYSNLITNLYNRQQLGPRMKQNAANATSEYQKATSQCNTLTEKMDRFAKPLQITYKVGQKKNCDSTQETINVSKNCFCLPY